MRGTLTGVGGAEERGVLLVEVLVRFKLLPCSGMASCLAKGADAVDIAEAERADMGDPGGWSIVAEVRLV